MGAGHDRAARDAVREPLSVQRHKLPVALVGSVPEGGKVYCSARDVTQDKLRAEELALTQEALRQSQKLEAIGQLTGGVAHDFNNLLTVIRGSVELLRRFPDLPSEERTRYVETTGETVTRAAKLTSQLLAFARRQALTPEVFELNAAVSKLEEMLARLVGARVQTWFLPGTMTSFVNTDRSQFETALLNLIVNGADAMNGEGTLTIAVSHTSQIPALRNEPLVLGAYVAVSVKDTGLGIAAEQLDLIFEPFFTTKKVGQGTGLGLSQVFGFAKQSGGDLRVESTLAKVLPSLSTCRELRRPWISSRAARQNVFHRPEAPAFGYS